MCTCSQKLKVDGLLLGLLLCGMPRFHFMVKCLFCLNFQWKCNEGFHRNDVLFGQLIHCLSFVLPVSACDFVVLVPLQSSNNFCLDMSPCFPEFFEKASKLMLFG